MGTNGLIRVIANKQKYCSYNHLDSYPSGLGTQLVSQLATLLLRFGSYSAVASQFAQKLKLVRDDDATCPPPTAAEMASITTACAAVQSPLMNMITQQVQSSHGLTWYSACRGMQGNILLSIETGYWLEYGDVPQEYVYELDFDKEQLSCWHYATLLRVIPFADLNSNVFNGE